jgi:hypothetical protein
MKHAAAVLAILAALSASIALADDFKTIDGKEYKNAKLSRVEPDGIVVRTKSGITKIYFVELPKEVADKWLAPIRAAERAAEENRIKEQQAAEENRIKEQQAAEEKRAAAEQERTEKENKAGVELKPAIGQFQAAEQRASQAYQSATKGTLSGQVFVSTTRGENFKLGAAQVSLFARDATDALLKGVKNYADYKIQQLSGPVADAKATLDQAEANEKAASDAVFQAIKVRGDWKEAQRTQDVAREAAKTAGQQYWEIDRELSVCYSGAFYFAYLQSPIQTVETDADGKFAIEVPLTGTFVIAAQARRSVGDYTEHYYWLQPVSLEGQQHRVQNLSNNNLTSTTGTSSLILTKD